MATRHTMADICFRSYEHSPTNTQQQQTTQAHVSPPTQQQGGSIQTIRVSPHTAMVMPNEQPQQQKKTTKLYLYAIRLANLNHGRLRCSDTCLSMALCQRLPNETDHSRHTGDECQWNKDQDLGTSMGTFRSTHECLPMDRIPCAMFEARSVQYRC